jgi:tetratricopeptide (TPR) repeat protein
MLTVTNSLKGLLLLESGDFAVGRAAMERANKYMMPPYELSAPNYAARAAFYRALVDLKSNDIPAVAAELAEMKNLMPAIREKTPELLRSFKKQLTMVSAELSLAQGRPGDAIKCSEKALDIYAPHATGGTLYTLYPRVNDPFDQDIIPRAYAAKGDLRRAITEYEKLLTFDPASRDRRLRNPRYEYRLAKLLEKRGDSAKALTHYEKFLDYWKDADSDRPELIDAKARVAMLKSPHG